MHKVLILACYTVIICFVSSKYVNAYITKELRGNKNGTVLTAVSNVTSETLNKLNNSKQSKSANSSKTVNKNAALLSNTLLKVVSKIRYKPDDLKKVKQVNDINSKKSNSSRNTENEVSERNQSTKKNLQASSYILQKIHARITRSKDAVWATITLTVLCILLVLAVAQSRMWKDHYYTESQGVPLPNFNERVLFKDVMERKISSLKQFFKKPKRSQEKNVTELESLLPPSEWDS